MRGTDFIHPKLVENNVCHDISKDSKSEWNHRPGTEIVDRSSWSRRADKEVINSQMNRPLYALFFPHSSLNISRGRDFESKGFCLSLFILPEGEEKRRRILDRATRQSTILKWKRMSRTLGDMLYYRQYLKSVL